MESPQPILNDFFRPWTVSFERSAALWARQFETAERIGSANVSAFRAAFDTSSTRKHHEAKDTAENVFAFSNSLAQVAEAATACSALMAQLASEASGELSLLAIKYVNKWSDVQVDALNKMADKAPLGLDAVFKALGPIVSSAGAAQAHLLETFVSGAAATEHGMTKAHKEDLPTVVEAK